MNEYASGTLLILPSKDVYLYVFKDMQANFYVNHGDIPPILGTNGHSVIFDDQALLVLGRANTPSNIGGRWYDLMAGGSVFVMAEDHMHHFRVIS